MSESVTLPVISAAKAESATVVVDGVVPLIPLELHAVAASGYSGYNNANHLSHSHVHSWPSPIGILSLRRRLARVCATAAFAALVVAYVFAPAAAGQATQSRTTYEVYGVRFAGLRGYPLSELVLGEDSTHRADLAFMVWVLKPVGDKGRGHVVLFDAGFYREKIRGVETVRLRQTIRCGQEGRMYSPGGCQRYRDLPRSLGSRRRR